MPSLVAQIQDYVSGQAHDPVLRRGRQAGDGADRWPNGSFALQYLFQANPVQHDRPLSALSRVVGALSQRPRARPEGAESYFVTRDYADLQVLSQLAWFDEFFLDEPDIADSGRRRARTSRATISSS